MPEERLAEKVGEYLRAGGDPNGIGSDGLTLLQRGAKEAKSSVVLVLLENGADPNYVGSAGTSALHYAAYTGSLKSVEHLLNFGAYADSVDSHAATPLSRQLTEDCINNPQTQAIIMELLEAGADRNIQTEPNGDKLIHYAASKNWTRLLEWLIEKGDNVEATASGGPYAEFGPLHYATLSSSMESICLLLNANADVNAIVNRTGETALHIACRKRDKPVVEYLLQRGADPRMTTRDGNQPRDLVTQWQLEDGPRPHENLVDDLLWLLQASYEEWNRH